MATEPSEPASSTPYTQGHKRSKTAILRAIVSPHKGHKKSMSTSPGDGAVPNPLNAYMFNGNAAPQLPPINPSLPLLPPLDLEPPSAPFAREDRKKRMHKKSLSSISLSSMMSRKEDRDRDRDMSPSTPASPRGSFDISGALRDLMTPNRAYTDYLSTSPQKPTHSKQPSKSKSAIDISLLRRKQDKREVVQPCVKDNKENRQPREPLTPLSPRSIHGLVSRDAVDHRGRLPPEQPSIAPPKFHPSGNGRPRLTPHNSNSSIHLTTPPRTSISSEERYMSVRRRETEELMKRYTPTEYTPKSQRNFGASGTMAEPALIKPSERDSHRERDSSKGWESKPRPKSAYFPSATPNRFSISAPRKSHEHRSVEKLLPDPPKKAEGSPAGSHSSKGSGKQTAGLDLEGIDTAFEALLVSTHILSLAGYPLTRRTRTREECRKT